MLWLKSTKRDTLKRHVKDSQALTEMKLYLPHAPQTEDNTREMSLYLPLLQGDASMEKPHRQFVLGFFHRLMIFLLFSFLLNKTGSVQ